MSHTPDRPTEDDDIDYDRFAPIARLAIKQRIRKNIEPILSFSETLDRIDAALAGLLESRDKVSIKIWALKQHHWKTPFDATREEELKTKMFTWLFKEIEQNLVLESQRVILVYSDVFWDEVMGYSKYLQSRFKAAPITQTLQDDWITFEEALEPLRLQITDISNQIIHLVAERNKLFLSHWNILRSWMRFLHRQWNWEYQQIFDALDILCMASQWQKMETNSSIA